MVSSVEVPLRGASHFISPRHPIAKGFTEFLMIKFIIIIQTGINYLNGHR